MDVTELDFDYYSHLVTFEVNEQYKLLGLKTEKTVKLKVVQIKELDDVQKTNGKLTSVGHKPNGIRVLCSNVSRIDAIVKYVYLAISEMPEDMIGKIEEFPIKKGEWELFAFVKRDSDFHDVQTGILSENVVFRFGSVRAMHDWQ